MPDVGVSAEWIRDSIMKITALCERIITKQEEQDRRIEKVEKKVDEISEKPAKRWDIVVTASLTTVIGLLIGAFLAIPKP
jgi:hypothetical protein